MALEPGEFLDAASLLETAGWLRQQLREEAAKSPLLAARAASVGDFRDMQAAIRGACCRTARSAMIVGDAAANPGEHHGDS